MKVSVDRLKTEKVIPEVGEFFREEISPHIMIRVNEYYADKLFPKRDKNQFGAYCINHEQFYCVSLTAQYILCEPINDGKIVKEKV